MHTLKVTYVVGIAVTRPSWKVFSYTINVHQAISQKFKFANIAP